MEPVLLYSSESLPRVLSSMWESFLPAGIYSCSALPGRAFGWQGFTGLLVIAWDACLPHQSRHRKGWMAEEEPFESLQKENELNTTTAFSKICYKQLLNVIFLEWACSMHTSILPLDASSSITPSSHKQRGVEKVHTSHSDIWEDYVSDPCIIQPDNGKVFVTLNRNVSTSYVHSCLDKREGLNFWHSKALAQLECIFCWYSQIKLCQLRSFKEALKGGMKT